ncbi:MAG TPA: right-handed parallel beta-helix repeat-containing protein [Bacteroidales bacterium]|nr:right-handed parallel beta-helix repeat-containing protein [Bacteroidales bacterium]
MKKLFFITAGLLLSLLVFSQGPGDLYLPFSNDGYYIENWVDTITMANGVAVTPDGNLLIPGIIRPSENSSFLMMMDKNGNSLPGNMHRGFSMDFTTNPDEAAKAVKIAPDGKILVAGYYLYHMYHPWIVRLLPDGRLDESFGTAGVFDVSSVNMDVQGMAIYQSGDSYSIILGGTSTTGNHPSLIMINDGGSLVTEFGTDGVTSLSATTGSFKSLSVDNENSVLYASGFVTEGAGTIIAKYDLPGGFLNTDFGTDGSLVYPPLVFPGAPLAQVLDQSDNTLTLFGSYKHTVGDHDMFAYRLNAATGDADPSFGQSGWVLLRIPEDNEEITGARLQDDGKYCFAGDYTTMDGNTNLFAGRIMHNGSADVAFGTNGLLVIPAAGGQFVAGLSLSPRQNIMYITGTNVDAVNSAIFVVAYCTGYETEPKPVSVINTRDAGIGSLRQALMDANLNPGPDTIIFNIPLSDPGYNSEKGIWSIRPLSALPCLEDDNTVLDGTLQALNNGNLNASGPEIEINGGNLIETCLRVTGKGMIIKGLVINGFVSSAVEIENQNTILKGNYLGISSDGTLSIPNDIGIKISNHAKHNQIGGDLPEDLNVISGNTAFGIMLINDADSNIIRGNFIGTNSNGSGPLANGRGGIGIINGSSSNTIGGIFPAERNIISGNSSVITEDLSYGNGIYIERSDSNIITGNFIGTDKLGISALSNSGYGIYAYRSSRNHIGGTEAGEGNVISGNGHGGICLNFTYCVSNIISGNYIGTGPSGTDAIPNAGYGINLHHGSISNMIGPYNRIMNNGLSGIACTGENSMSNTFTMNYISNNEGDGIYLDGEANQAILAPVITDVTSHGISGTTVAGHVVELFSDTADEGSVYEGSATADSYGHFEWSGHVACPFVTATSTDADGNTSAFSPPASNTPVEPLNLTVTNTFDSGEGSLRQAIQEAEENPGTDTVKFNIPEDDPGYNVSQKVWIIQPLTSFSYLSAGNTIIDGTTQTLNVGNTNPTGPEIMINGTDVAGTGFVLFSDSNAIKGVIINGFEYSAIQVMGDWNRITGNYLGCSASGTEPIPNQDGISVVYGSKHTLIGGNVPEDRNVISGNLSSGIQVGAPGTDSTIIKGNFIGTDYTGEDTLCNGYCGIHLVNRAAYTMIGGPAEGDRNIITGIRKTTNIYTGNAITIEQSDFNSIQGNYIGTNHDGSAVLYNGPRGILIARGEGNQIGGTAPGEGNVISGHTCSGILIRFSESHDNLIEGNFIGTGPEGSDSLGNAQAGIELDYGANNNRVGPSNVIMYNGYYGVYSLYDSTFGNTITGNLISHHIDAGIMNEEGANDTLECPEITDVTTSGVSGTSCSGCTVEIFSDTGDEGEFFEGFTLADNAGNFSWPGLVTGPYVTATATDLEGNTSEFSVPFEVSSAVDVKDLQSESSPVLRQNIPNPFSDHTYIGFTLAEKSLMSLTVYDLMGRKIAVLADGLRQAGNYEELWDGSDTGGNRVTGGIYYCVLKTGNKVYVRKMVFTEE